MWKWENWCIRTLNVHFNNIHAFLSFRFCEILRTVCIQYVCVCVCACMGVCLCIQYSPIVLPNILLRCWCWVWKTLGGKAPLSDRWTVSDRPTSSQPYIFKVEYHHVTTLHTYSAIHDMCQCVGLFCDDTRGGQLPLKGGHHARLWTFKMDPKQVIILRFFPPWTSIRSCFPYPKQVFCHVSPTLNKYFQIKCKKDTPFQVSRASKPSLMFSRVFPFHKMCLPPAWQYSSPQSNC